MNDNKKFYSLEYINKKINRKTRHGVPQSNISGSSQYEQQCFVAYNVTTWILQYFFNYFEVPQGFHLGCFSSEFHQIILNFWLLHRWIHIYLTFKPCRKKATKKQECSTAGQHSRSFPIRAIKNLTLLILPCRLLT